MHFPCNEAAATSLRPDPLAPQHSQLNSKSLAPHSQPTSVSRWGHGLWTGSAHRAGPAPSSPSSHSPSQGDGCSPRRAESVQRPLVSQSHRAFCSVFTQSPSPVNHCFGLLAIFCLPQVLPLSTFPPVSFSATFPRCKAHTIQPQRVGTVLQRCFIVQGRSSQFLAEKGPCLCGLHLPPQALTLHLCHTTLAQVPRPVSSGFHGYFHCCFSSPSTRSSRIQFPPLWGSLMRILHIWVLL